MGTTTSGGVSGYVATVLADKPLAYYRLNELEGTIAMDSSGNGLNGTYGTSVVLGSPSLLPAAPAELAAGFDGGDADPANYVRVPPSPLLEPTAGVSIETWLSVSAFPGPVLLGIISYGDDSTYPYQPYILRLDDSQLTFQVVAGAAIAAVSSPTGIELQEVYHVVGTYDTNTLSLYLNGQLVAWSMGGGALSNYDSTNGLGIGHRYTSTEPVFDGELGEVAIYGKALTAGEVMAHYLAGAE